MNIRIHCSILYPQTRLDLYLRSLPEFEDFSRTFITDLIATRHAVMVNEKTTTKPSISLRCGDVLTLICTNPAEPRHAFLSASETPLLHALYEDAHCLVIAKPLGMAVHPAGEHDHEKSIVDALLTRKDIHLNIKGTHRPGIVHRLDKWTSGCLLLAKHDRAVDFFVRMFQERRVHKTYIALLHGSFPHIHGHIEAPVGRHPTHRQRMSVTQGGKPSLTEFFLRDSNTYYSLMEIILHTGRTHQIRVHFSSVGYPVVGDSTYGKKDIDFPHLLQGQFLHAWKLRFPLFNHPEQYQEISCPLPPSFNTVLIESGLDFSFLTPSL